MYFYIPNTKTVRDFQEVVTLVRSTADLRYLFTYNAARAVAVRGTDDQIALAKWLCENLDTASIPESANDSALTSIGFRPPATTSSGCFTYPRHHAGALQETAAEVRQKLVIRRAFTYNVPNALVIRDTAQKISQAEKLIQEQDK